MEVFGWDNEDGESAASMAAKLIGTAEYSDLSAKSIEEDRLILAGTRGDRSFYELYTFRGTSVQAFGMDYPKDLSATYDPLRDEIAATFLHGDEDMPDALAGDSAESEVAAPVSPALPVRVASPGLARSGQPADQQQFRILRRPARAAVLGGKPPKAGGRDGKPSKASGKGRDRPKGKRAKRNRGKGNKR